MEKRIEQTYDKLLKAITLLLKEKDFEDISISELCKKAKVERPTFYNHFKDKEDFVIQMIRYLYKKRNVSIDDIKDFKEYCKAFLIYVLKYIDKIKNPDVKKESKIGTSKLYLLCFKEIHNFLRKRYSTRKYKDIKEEDEEFFVYRMSSRLLASLVYFYNSKISLDEMIQHIDVTLDFHYI